jgi:hypothetical protein
MSDATIDAGPGLADSAPIGMMGMDASDDAGPADVDASADSDAMTEIDAASVDAMPMIRDGGGSEDAGSLDAMVVTPATPLSWGRMTLPANTETVRTIWGRSSNEIYAGTTNGKVLRFDPSNGWTKVWDEPSNFGIVTIWGTPTKIFVASDHDLHVHNGTIGTGVMSYSVGSQIYDMRGRSDTEVYIVSDQQNGRGLYAYDGSRINTIIEPTDVATLASLAIVANGPVYVGANGGLYKYQSMVYSAENVMWPSGWSQNDILQFVFNGLAIVGNDAYAVGSRYEVFIRDPGLGTWRLLYNPLHIADAHAAAGLDNGADTEMYVVGSDTSTFGSVVRLYQGNWTDSFPGTDQLDLWSIWPAGLNEYYAAGNEANMFVGVILKGTR